MGLAEFGKAHLIEGVLDAEPHVIEYLAGLTPDALFHLLDDFLVVFLEPLGG